MRLWKICTFMLLGLLSVIVVVGALDKAGEIFIEMR